MAFTLFKAVLILIHIMCLAFWLVGTSAAQAALAHAPGKDELARRFRIQAAAGALFVGPVGLGLVYANWSATNASVWLASLIAATFWLLFLVDFIRRPAPRPSDRHLLEKLLRYGAGAAAAGAGLAILSGLWLSPPPYVGIKFLCLGGALALMVHAPEVKVGHARFAAQTGLLLLAAFMGVWRPVLVS